MEIVNLDRHQSGVDVLLDQKHAAFKPLLFPFLSIKVIQTNMTELVQDGCYRGIATFEYSEVVVIYRVRCEYVLFLELW